ASPHQFTTWDKDSDLGVVRTLGGLLPPGIFWGLESAVGEADLGPLGHIRVTWKGGAHEVTSVFCGVTSRCTKATNLARLTFLLEGTPNECAYGHPRNWLLRVRNRPPRLWRPCVENC